jgi:hypothetical protein
LENFTFSTVREHFPLEQTIGQASREELEPSCENSASSPKEEAAIFQA